MANYAIQYNHTALATEVAAELRAELERQPLLDHTQPIVFAVGGDGTLLNAIRQHLHDNALFVGISAGTLGFLQSVQRDQISDIIKALNQQTYEVLSAPLLTAHYQTDPDTKLGYAFNDISIERKLSQAVKFDLSIDNSTGSFIGDGVIFSTPLGSTAYSLAAGGPIVDSKLENTFVVTPSNPHFSSLYSSLQRPHVIHRSRAVDIHFDPDQQSNRPASLAFDGNIIEASLDQDLQITMSDKIVQLVQLNSDEFHSRIEAKRLGRN